MAFPRLITMSQTTTSRTRSNCRGPFETSCTIVSTEMSSTRWCSGRRRRTDWKIMNR